MTSSPGACLSLALLAALAQPAPAPAPAVEARAPQTVATWPGQGQGPALGQCAWSRVAGHGRSVHPEPRLERAGGGHLPDGMAHNAMARCQRSVRVLRA